jgi:hypothetical protein
MTYSKKKASNTNYTRKQGQCESVCTPPPSSVLLGKDVVYNSFGDRPFNAFIDHQQGSRKWLPAKMGIITDDSPKKMNSMKNLRAHRQDVFFTSA